MNNLIREIAESVDPQAWRQQHPDDEEWCMKFGELIIQQCIRSIFDHSETYAHPSAGFWVATSFADVIKKDFGIN